jgi:hypothetical protein
MRLPQSLIALLIATVMLQTRVTSQVMAAPHLAGHWHVTTSITCVSNGYNLDACQKISGSTFAVFSLQGATLKIRASSEYAVNARGKFTGHGSTVITEQARGHASLRGCNPSKLASTLWSGTCYTAWNGHGHVAPGKMGLPDFWLDHGITTIHGTSPLPPYQARFSTPSDSRLPAVAGVYSTSHYFKILHLTPVRGVSIRTTVVHSP